MIRNYETNNSTSRRKTRYAKGKGSIMPKVFITKQDKLNDRLLTLILGTMRLKKISQESMASEMGITRQAFGKKIKSRHFTFSDLVTIFGVLELSDEQILSVMR